MGLLNLINWKKLYLLTPLVWVTLAVFQHNTGFGAFAANLLFVSLWVKIEDVVCTRDGECTAKKTKPLTFFILAYVVIRISQLMILLYLVNFLVYGQSLVQISETAVFAAMLLTMIPDALGVLNKRRSKVLRA